jgi:hypothetical protein
MQRAAGAKHYCVPLAGTSPPRGAFERASTVNAALLLTYIVAHACVCLTDWMSGAPLGLQLPPLVGSDI